MGLGSILLIAIPVAGVISAPFLRNAFEMRREKNYREMAGSIFWGLIPFAVVCLIWATNGDSPVNIQNCVLGLVGAAIGASGLIWIGYVVRPITPALAQNNPPNAEAMTGKNTVTIGGSNNNVTIGHIGDINVPGPELKLSSAQGSQNPDGSFVAVFDAQIVAPYTPGSLRVEAWAAGITKLDIAPQRTGMAMYGHGGVRPDYAFSTVMQPFGWYKIYVTTKAPTNVEIRYAFDQ